MSPVLEIESIIPDKGVFGPPEQIGNFPDSSGIYKTTDGDPVEIDMDGIVDHKGVVVLNAEFLKGRERTSGGPKFGPSERKVQIGKKGRGSVDLDSNTRLTVILKHK